MKSEVKVLSERADYEQQKNEERFLMLERQICDLKKPCPPSFAQVGFFLFLNLFQIQTYKYQNVTTSVKFCMQFYLIK